MTWRWVWWAAVGLLLTGASVCLIVGLGALVGVISWDAWRTEPLAFFVLVLFEGQIVSAAIQHVRQRSPRR